MKIILFRKHKKKNKSKTKNNDLLSEKISFVFVITCFFVFLFCKVYGVNFFDCPNEKFSQFSAGMALEKTGEEDAGIANYYINIAAISRFLRRGYKENPLDY